MRFNPFPRPLPALSPMPEGVQEFRHEYPDAEMVLRWCIPNSIRSHVPVLAQGFLGVWEGRPDPYWFPDNRIQYTSTLKYTHATLEEARAVALANIDKAIADLQAKREEVLALTSQSG